MGAAGSGIGVTPRAALIALALALLAGCDRQPPSLLRPDDPQVTALGALVAGFSQAFEADVPEGSNAEVSVRLDAHAIVGKAAVVPHRG